MELRINGDKRDVALADETVAGVLDALALPRVRVAVEHNGEIVRRSDHAGHTVHSGDALEIVTLVGGG